MSEYRKTVKDIDVKGKKVMIRAGLDVPLDIEKDLLDPDRVTDNTRIKDVLPTLKVLIENDAKIILAAGWCDRPKGEDPDYSMAPVAKNIERLLKEKNLLKHPVLLAPNSFEDKKPRSVYKNKDEVKKIVDSLKEGQIVVLENVRYDPEANANDKDFAVFMASLAEAYVNEAETQNHRPEATVVSTPVLIAEKCGPVVYGLKYVDVLDKIGDLSKTLESKDRGPFVFGLCGKKIESDPGITSKITVALALLDKMRKGDTMITGGAVTYTFLLAQHYASKINENIREVNKIVEKYDQKILSEVKSIKDKKEAAKKTEEFQKQKSDELKNLLKITDKEIKELVGDSYIRWGQEGEQIVFAYNVMTKAKEKEVEVSTAFDHTIANALPNKSGVLPENTEIKTYSMALKIPESWLGVGEGPRTLEKFQSKIENASIYLQSGPFSIEDPRVEEISKTDEMIFKGAKRCKDKGSVTIGAGGDTVARIHTRKAEDAFSVITSAGGATLELIQTGTSRGKKAVEQAQEVKK